MIAHNLLWFLIGAACSYAINQTRATQKSKKEEEKPSSKEKADAKVVSLALGDPYFVMNAEHQDLRFKAPKDRFHLAFPENTKQQILAIKPTFFNAQWEEAEHFLDGQSKDDFIQKAASALDITPEKFKQMLQESERQVAESLLQKIEAGEPYFIGYMYCIQKMQPNREGIEERPTVDVSSFLSDYYTHRVMANIYRKVYRNNPEIAPSRISPQLAKLRYFLTSFGIDTLIILADEGEHGSVVFAKRSGKLYNMREDMWHEAMNEAVSVSDLDETTGTISFEKAIARGIREELGVDLKTGKYPYDIQYSDIALIQDPLEAGVSAFVTIHNLTYKDLELMYLSAKDRELESVGLTMVPLDEGFLEAFLSQNHVTPACTHMVEMLISKHLNIVAS